MTEDSGRESGQNEESDETSKDQQLNKSLKHNVDSTVEALEVVLDAVENMVSNAEDSKKTMRTEDKGDSAIDLSKEIEDLNRAQRSLDRMLACAVSPSTSGLGAEGREKEDINAQVRRLIRVPCGDSSAPPFTVRGGASEAQLVLVDLVLRPDLIGLLHTSDRLMTLDNIPISGMLRTEVKTLINRLCNEKDQIAIEVIPAEGISSDLCEILSNKEFGQLQTVIRDNLYSKTVPYTSRPPRAGEVDGEHYRFVSQEEFQALLQAGLLLEHGTYQGHLYGSPRPEEPRCGEMVQAGTRGPLPPNWEIGYAENGDKYFIDHNNGTTTWDDPRMLPSGWEEVEDPVYGTFYVDHINQKTQYERPNQGVSFADHNSNQWSNNGHETAPRSLHSSPASQRSVYVFTRDPDQLQGVLKTTTVVKGSRGLGFTLIGNDASSKGDEFIQVKSILPGGPAEKDGILQPGDILVRVNGQLVLGATQMEACRIFLSIAVDDPVALQICRGYPLMIDPNNKIITENVYATGGRSRDLQEINVHKGPEGFGFTIADSISGQRVKKILYPEQCPNLMEGDTIVELDGRNVRAVPHTQLVDMLRELPVGHRGRIVVRRTSPKHNSRSRTPSAAFRYGDKTSSQTAAVAPRSKTPAPSQRAPSVDMISSSTLRPTTLQRQPNVDDARGIRQSSTTLGFATPNYMPLHSFMSQRSEDLITINLGRKPNGFGFRLLGGSETNTMLTVGQIVAGGAAAEDRRMREGDEIVEIDGRRVEGAAHSEAVALLEQAAVNKHVKMVVRRPKPELTHSVSLPSVDRPPANGEYDVCLERNDSDGFGFIIISSLNRSGSTIGQILDNSPASACERLKVGDRVVAVNGINILNLNHGEIVSLIKASGTSVRLTIAPPVQDPLAQSTLTRQTTSNGFGSSPKTNGYSSQYSTIPSYSTVPSTTVPSMQPSTVPPPYANGTLQQSPARYSSMYSEITKVDPNRYAPAPGDYPGPEQVSAINVELERGARGFGFSIRGGQEFGSMPLFVLRIADDGPAAIDGRLKVGDQVISINGRGCRGLSHEDAIQLIKQHPTVRLVVQRHSLS